MELVLKTSGQKCLVGSNPTPSATHGERVFPSPGTGGGAGVAAKARDGLRFVLQRAGFESHALRSVLQRAGFEFHAFRE